MRTVFTEYGHDEFSWDRLLLCLDQKSSSIILPARGNKCPGWYDEKVVGWYKMESMRLDTRKAEEDK